MKRPTYLLVIVISLCLLLCGCVIKPARVQTRRFVLVPIPAAEHATKSQRPPAEVGFVRMPSYLLRDSMVIRKSTDEVEYLETALWAERLDRSFRETLEQNLSLLLASASANRSSPERARVSINVEQFDVDIDGRGTLLAEWRLTAAGADEPMKTGRVRLTRSGPSPRANPQAIASTLSGLLAEFSQELAPALSQSQVMQQNQF